MAEHPRAIGGDSVVGLLGFRYCTVSVGSIPSIPAVFFPGLLGYASLSDRLTGVELLGATLIIVGCVAVAATESRSARQGSESVRSKQRQRQ